MRKYIALLVLTAAATQAVIAFAQDQDNAAPLALPFQLLQQAQQEYDQTESARITRVNQELPRLNQEINVLTSNREPLASQIDFMDNVVSLRKKDDMERWVEAARKRWDADNGGHRVGVSNPYNSNEFYRYYDKNDELVVSKVRGDYDTLKQQSAAWDQSYKRARDAAESLNNDYDAVVSQFSKITAIKAQIAESQQQRRPSSDSRSSQVKVENGGGGVPKASSGPYTVRWHEGGVFNNPNPTRTRQFNTYKEAKAFWSSDSRGFILARGLNRPREYGIFDHNGNLLPDDYEASGE